MEQRKFKKRKTGAALSRELPNSLRPSRPAPEAEENQHTAAKKYYRDMERVARIVRALHDKQKSRLCSKWNTGVELQGGRYDAEVLRGNSALELLEVHLKQAIEMQEHLVENIETSAALLRLKLSSRAAGGS